MYSDTNDKDREKRGERQRQADRERDSMLYKDIKLKTRQVCPSFNI